MNSSTRVWYLQGPGYYIGTRKKTFAGAPLRQLFSPLQRCIAQNFRCACGALALALFFEKNIVHADDLLPLHCVDVEDWLSQARCASVCAESLQIHLLNVADVGSLPHMPATTVTTQTA
jgi:hypothetical protein